MRLTRCTLLLDVMAAGRHCLLHPRHRPAGNATLRQPRKLRLNVHEAIHQQRDARFQSADRERK